MLPTVTKLIYCIDIIIVWILLSLFVSITCPLKTIFLGYAFFSTKILLLNHVYNYQCLTTLYNLYFEFHHPVF